ncbi:YaeQ family protein [Salinicola avicenniae]|uniref:YaeQ family protein n=1 Tax=Salinicola avicenniae TaxID=2916836 RepID=UPI00207443FE|nr:YaeQ family protein [Salinicola sp. S1-1-8]
MALSATIYKTRLNVSDLDRHYYGAHALTIACHPSETPTRLMARLIAFIDNAHDDLAMTRGLSNDDEPDLWLQAEDGRTRLWIELGEPSLKRIKQGLSRAERVRIYPYSPRSAEQWWKKLGADVSALSRVEVWNLPAEPLAALTERVSRNLALDATLMEGEWLITDGTASVSLALEPWHQSDTSAQQR